MFGPTVNLIFAALLTLAAGVWIFRHVRRRDWPIAALFLVAVALAGYFGFRVVDRALYWSSAAHQQMAPEAWMSPGLIERSWNLPPRSLAPVIGITPDQGKRRSLDDIAALTGEPVGDLIARIEAALPELAAQPSGQP